MTPQTKKRFFFMTMLAAMAIGCQANVPAEKETYLYDQELSSNPDVTETPSQSDTQQKGETVAVIMDTSYGEIHLSLDAEKAPDTVANFLQYVDDQFYDGTIFHRVISNFMIQCGGFESGMQEKPTRAPIKNEAANGLQNDRGTIAMARTNVPDSATAQFFINVTDNDFLNFKNQTEQGIGYCVFGTVTKGIEVVDQIRQVATGSKGGHGDVPVDDVLIKSIRRSE